MSQIKKTSVLFMLLLTLLGFRSCAHAASWIESADVSWYASADVSGDADNPYVISTGEQLAGIAKLVKETSTNFSGKTIVLNKNIDLKSIEWEPIGRFMNNWNNYGFAGTFDGRGHSITGLLVTQVTGENTECPSLFGYLTSAGTIKNIYTEGIVQNNVAQGAAILVTWNCGNVINCVVSGDAVAQGKGRGYVGGISAVANGGIYRNCVVYGRYSAESSGMNYCGGLVGYAHQGAQTYFYNNVGLAAYLNPTSALTNGNGSGGINGGLVSSQHSNDYWLYEEGNEHQMNWGDGAYRTSDGCTSTDIESKAPVSAVMLDPAMSETHPANTECTVTLITYPLLSSSSDVKCTWAFDDPDVKVISNSGSSVIINSSTEGEKSFTVKITGINGIPTDNSSNAITLKGSVLFKNAELPESGSSGCNSGFTGLLLLSFVPLLCLRKNKRPSCR